MSAKNEADQCAFALCLSELHITLAKPTLGGVYQAGAAFFWPFALGFSLARSGFNWNQPLW
jgi:hypothetical protein